MIVHRCKKQTLTHPFVAARTCPSCFVTRCQGWTRPFWSPPLSPLTNDERENFHPNTPSNLHIRLGVSRCCIGYTVSNVRDTKLALRIAWFWIHQTKRINAHKSRCNKIKRIITDALGTTSLRKWSPDFYVKQPSQRPRSYLRISNEKTTSIRIINGRGGPLQLSRLKGAILKT